VDLKSMSSFGNKLGRLTSTSSNYRWLQKSIVIQSCMLGTFVHLSFGVA
jgi:hypothetical protein